MRPHRSSPLQIQLRHGLNIRQSDRQAKTPGAFQSNPMGSTPNFNVCICLQCKDVRRFGAQFFPSFGAAERDQIRTFPVPVSQHVDALHTARGRFGCRAAHHSLQHSHHPRLEDASHSNPGTAVCQLVYLSHAFHAADLPFSYREFPQICCRRVVPIPPNILSPA